MTVNFDENGIARKRYIILENPNGEELGSLGNALDIDISYNFNTLSEITMKVLKNDPYYELIEANRVISVENIGKFIITNPSEYNNGIEVYKQIKGYSLERELVDRNIGYIKGTLKFYSALPSEIPNTMMGKLMARLNGTWKLGHVDEELYNVYRDYDIIDQSWYNFVIEDVEKTYGCIFKFDTFNRIINVYTTENSTINSDIYLSLNNLLKDIRIESDDNQLCTSLEVLGGGGLDIRQVNPLGTNFLYDFSHFINNGFLSGELTLAVLKWEEKIEAQTPIYTQKLLELKALLQERISFETTIYEIESDILALKQSQSVAINAGDSAEVKRINGQIKAKQNELENKKASYKTLETRIKNKNDELVAINNIVKPENNFTKDQLKELTIVSKEKTFQEPNIIKLPEWDDLKVLENALILYEEGKKVLNKLSKPRYTFKINSVNFLNLQDYNEFIKQIELGTKVLIETETGFNIGEKAKNKIYEYTKTPLKEMMKQKLRDILYSRQILIEPVLIQINFSLTDPSKLDLIFSNRLRLPSEDMDFEELMGKTIQTTTQVNGNSILWGDWIESGSQQKVTDFVSSALDASKNELISSDNQTITMGAYGLQGKEVDPNGGFLPEQCWLTGRNLAFTKDGWDSVELALGRVQLPNGQWSYGIASQSIIGRMIFGNQLAIQNEGGTITMDANGLKMTGGFNIDTPVLKLEPNDIGINVSGTNGSFVVNKNDILNFQSNLGGGEMSLSPNGLVMVEQGGLARAIVSPVLGFALQKKVGSGWDNQMWLDINGNANFKGNITASTITGSTLIAGDQNGVNTLLSTNEPFQIRQGTNKVIEIWAESFSQGMAWIRMYNPSTGQVRFEIDSSSLTKEINAEDKLEINCARNRGDLKTGWTTMNVGTIFNVRNMGSSTALEVNYSNDGVSIGANSRWRTYVNGDLTASGSKPATVQTEHYGWRQLYAEESDRIYFNTHGTLSTKQNNQGKFKAIIRLDEIFFETIEPNSIFPYFVQLTPHTLCNIACIKKYDKYIIVESDEETEFDYTIRCIRKKYGDKYMEEVGNVFRKDSMDEFSVRKRKEEENGKYSKFKH